MKGNLATYDQMTANATASSAVPSGRHTCCADTTQTDSRLLKGKHLPGHLVYPLEGLQHPCELCTDYSDSVSSF